MPNYYVYLISSLPSLVFGMKPPFSFDRFLKACEGLIPEEDMILVARAGDPGLDCAKVRNTTLRNLLSFERMLRNELVKIRASRKRVDPAKYLRGEECPESVYAAHIAINAYRKPSLLEAERSLDLDRWAHLEELSIGHYFDVEALVIYAHKLLILEKWDRIKSAPAHKLLEEVLS